MNTTATNTITTRGYQTATEAWSAADGWLSSRDVRPDQIRGAEIDVQPWGAAWMATVTLKKAKA